MTGRIRNILPLVIGVLLINGCGTSSPSHFYTLRSGAPTEASPALKANVSVAVGPVWMPAEVDRPQIVLSTGANTVVIDEFNRWASPLSSNTANVIAANLVLLLGTPRVAVYQQGSIPDPDYRVELTVLRFESAPGDAAIIDALWTVHVKGAVVETRTGHTVLRETVTGRNMEDLAAAHSRALDRLSRELADSIRLLALEGSKRRQGGQ